MGKTTSINAVDRTRERVQERDPDEATAELCQCITAANRSAELLARAFPSCIGVACFVTGKAPGALVLTASKEYLHYSPVAPDRLRTLARLVGHLPPELRCAFEEELATIPRDEFIPEAG
jgi:hypothetical protein